MEQLLRAFSEIQHDVPWSNIIVGVLFFIAAQIILKLVDMIFKMSITNMKDKRKALAIRKFCVYLFNLCLFIVFLRILNIGMNVVLGATGLMTIAIGFAARTPISNFISGVFLVFERPFTVGSIIEVNDVQGEVLARNLLSVTLRTLDNVKLRIPNEVVISSSVRNISFFPIRRLDVKYLISRKDSITRFEEVVIDVAARNVLALDEPEPYFYVSEFKENCTEVILKVWCSSDDFFTFQSKLPKEIHRAVKSAGMEDIHSSVKIAGPIQIEKGEQ